MIRRLVLTAVSLLALPVPPRVAAQATPIAVPAVERIAPDLELSRIMGAGLGSDGRICVLDDLELRLHCLRADGSLLWSFGRKGEGPGEWTSIYRMAIAPDNSILVLGFTTLMLHQVGQDGKFVRQARLPGFFGQFGSLLAISRDTFALSGVKSGRGDSTSAAVHLFVFRGDEIQHLRSFGELPLIKEPEKQRMLSVGFVQPSMKGTLLQTRGFPNTVSEYSMGGKLLRTVASPIVTLDPSSEMTITHSGNRVTYASVKPADGSNRVTAARELRQGQWWMVRSVTGGGQFFDVVDPATNRWLAPKPLPAWEASLGVFAEDRRGGYFLATTTCDDEPCLVRFRSAPYLAGGR